MDDVLPAAAKRTQRKLSSSIRDGSELIVATFP